MRYVLDDSGYIEAFSCNPIICDNKSCSEYTGTIPDGYSSLQEWAQNANIRAYKIVDGNLTYDEARAAALEAEWAKSPNGGQIYSTEEQIVGKWIDGKPIYKRTFYSTTNERNFNIPHGASIDTVVNIDGCYRIFNTTWFRLGCTYYLGNIEYLSALRVSGENIEVSLGSWINVNSNMITHVTIEYTKTTD